MALIYESKRMTLKWHKLVSLKIEPMIFGMAEAQIDWQLTTRWQDYFIYTPDVRAVLAPEVGEK